MPTVTPLNNWPVPVSTDLVKDGATAIEALGDAIDTSVGEGLLAWQSWAPTLSNGGSANGNGTWNADYCKIGKTVHIVGVFTLGSTSVIGTSPEVSLPFDANGSGYVVCPMRLNAGNNFAGHVFMQSTSKIRLFALNAASTYLLWNNVTSTVPGTWTTGHSISFAFTYETSE
jgi:hypothetical protein